jgi:hypothetical protein
MGCGMPYKKIRGTVRIPEDKFIEWLYTEERLKIDYDKLDENI